jgi:hypothetical protein
MLVRHFQQRNLARLWLDGSYFVCLNERYSPAPIWFRWRAPVRAAPNADQLRALPAGQPTIQRTMGGVTRSISPRVVAPSEVRERARGAQVSRDLAGFLELPAPTGPGHDTIHYGRVEYRLWYLRGAITMRAGDRDAPSPGNIIWPNVPRALGGGAAVSRATLGHGTCESDLVGQGAYRTRRYFGLIELVGTIEPQDAPGRFAFVRDLQSRTITSTLAPGGAPRVDQVVSPRADVSYTHMRVFDTQHGRGHVYDTDGPGAAMDYHYLVGGSEEYVAQFRQYLVVGDAGMHRLPPREPSEEQASQAPPPIQLHPSILLAEATWRFAAKYRVTTRGEPPARLENPDEVELGAPPRYAYRGGFSDAPSPPAIEPMPGYPFHLGA